SGRRRRRRRRRTSRRRPSWSATPTSTTWRRPKMSPEQSILTPEERRELAHTALAHERLQEQFADLRQQHAAATLGMWVFLVTEILFFGTLFVGLGVYRYLY